MIDELTVRLIIVVYLTCTTCSILGYDNFLMDKKAYVPYVRTVLVIILFYLSVLEYSQKNTQYPCTLVRTFYFIENKKIHSHVQCARHKTQNQQTM